MASRSAGRQRYQWALLLLAAVLLVAWMFVDGGQSSGSSDRAGASGSATVRTSGTDPDSGLPIVRSADLPEEAIRILDLIARGGPFDEDEDGSTFENREALLPDQPRGYYREYTVPTPGSGGRGARRIIGGEDGDLYWTPDHYRSFSRIADEG